MNDTPDARLANVEYASDLKLGCQTLGMPLSDDEYVSSAQFYTAMPFTLCPSPFACRVSIIVAARPQEEVIRTNAGGIVAAVQHTLTCGDRSEVQNPGDPMGVAFAQAGIGHGTVAMLIATASPFPARLRDLNLRPEAFFWRCRGRILVGHRVLQSLGARPPQCATTVGASSRPLYQMGA